MRVCNKTTMAMLRGRTERMILCYMPLFSEEVCFNAAIGACGGAGEIELLSTLRDRGGGGVRSSNSYAYYGGLNKFNNRFEGSLLKLFVCIPLFV